MARIGEQRAMQRALDHAGLRRRDQFGPRQIDFEKVVGHQQAAALVAVEQMMAAGNPEVGHLRYLLQPSRSDRLRRPACSSSPSTSRNEKRARRLARLRAGARCGTARALRRLRNSDARRSGYPCGCVQSDSAKATSSSAAALAAAKSGAPKRATNCCASSLDQRRRDLPRSPPRSAPASTSRAFRRREIRCGTPCAPCLQAPPDRDPRMQRRPTPPIRPARPAGRTRTCRKDRDVWCASGSCARRFRFRIVARTARQLRQQRKRCGLRL